MRMRYLLASAAIISLGVSSVHLSKGAYAQKGGVLASQTSWAVTEVNDPRKNTASYCAMAKRFQSNLILTIAQNKNNESSIAFDFSGANFNTKEYFAVTLDPGSGQQRSYEIRPASRKAFVMRLGKDPEFFRALQRTGFLRAEIGGQHYNFSLADIDAGQNLLESCIASTIMPAAGNAAQSKANVQDVMKVKEAANSQAIPYSSIKMARKEADALQRKLKELKAQIESIQNENKVLSENIQKERKKSSAHTLSSSSSPSSQSKSSSNAIISKASKPHVEDLGTFKRIREAKPLNADDKLDLALEGPDTKNETAAKAKEAKSNISKRNDRALKALGVYDEKKVVTSKLKTLRQENKDLKEADEIIADIKTRLNKKAVKDKINTLQNENKKLEEKLAQSDVKKDGTRKKLQSKVRLLEDENATLNKNLEAIEKSISSEYQKKLASLERANESLRLDIEKRSLDEELISHLRKQIGSLEEENLLYRQNKSVVSEEEANAIQKELNNALRQNETLQRSFESEQTLTKAQKQTIDNLEGHLSELKRHNKVLKTELMALKQDLDTNYKTTLSRVREENKELQSAIEKLSAENMSSQELKGQVQKVEAERKSLEMELVKTNEDAKKNALKLKEQLAQLEEIINQKDLALLKANTTAVSEEELKAEINEITLQNAKSVNLITELEESVERLETEKQELQIALNQEAEKVLDNEKQKQEIRDLQKENEGLKDKVASLSPMEAEYLSLKAQNEDLQKTLADKEASFVSTAQLQESLLDLEKQYKAVHASLENIEVKANSYQKTINEQAQTIEQLKQDKIALRDIAKQDKQAGIILDLHDEIDYLHEENRALATEMARLEENAPTESKFYSPLVENEVYSQLEQENEALRYELENTIIVAQKDKERALEALRQELLSDQDQQHASLVSKVSKNSNVVEKSQEKTIQPANYIPAQPKQNERAQKQAAIIDIKSSKQKEAELQQAIALKQKEEEKRIQEEVHKKELLRRQALKKEIQEQAKLKEAQAQTQAQSQSQSQKLADAAPKASSDKKSNENLSDQSDMQEKAPIDLVAYSSMTEAQRHEANLRRQINKRQSQPQEIAASSIDQVALSSNSNTVASLGEIEPSAGEGFEVAETAQELNQHLEAEINAQNTTEKTQEKSEDQLSNKEILEKAASISIAEEEKTLEKVLEEVATIDTKQASEAPKDLLAKNSPAKESMQTSRVRNAKAKKEASQRQRIGALRSSIEDVLKSAAIRVQGDIDSQQDNNNPSKIMHYWSVGNLYGSAEQIPLTAQKTDFDEYVLDYLETSKDRCSGDFAAIPYYTSPHNTIRVDSYEIACISEEMQAAATLIFYKENGTFTALAHEASTDNMAQTMDISDRLISALTSKESAS